MPSSQTLLGLLRTHNSIAGFTINPQIPNGQSTATTEGEKPSISAQFMGWFIRALLTGITAFAATNLDDILVLMMFFAQVNDRLRPRQIVIGQYLGFVVLLLACLPGFFGALIVPKSWIGLLGLLPIAIGLKQLVDRHRDDRPIQTVSTDLPGSGSKLAHFLHPQIYQVAAVALANGGDNLGIYVPLFANSDLPSLAVIVSVFLVLVAVWCWVAQFLAAHPAIAPFVTRYADRVVPFVLMGLGLYILIESGIYS